MPIRRSSPEIIVNSTTADDQFENSVAVLPDGRFFVSWTDMSKRGGDKDISAVRARIFNADGSQSAPEFLVNSRTDGSQDQSSVTALPDGRIMVSWTDFGQSVSGEAIGGVRARIFNPDGSEAVPEFTVSAIAGQGLSDIAALANGYIVATWSTLTLDGNIRARVFNDDGDPAGREFLVNSTSNNVQVQSSVASLPDGRFVVSWSDYSETGADKSGAAIRARILNADGSQSVPEILVNKIVTGNQTQSDIAVLPDGRFMISWSDESQSGGDTSGSAIRARIFNPDGSEDAAEFLVNTTTASDQIKSCVTALADGRFVISWTDYSRSSQATDGSAVLARIVNADGSDSVPEFQVNTNKKFDQFNSSISALADGRFVVVWSDNERNEFDSNVHAQVFDPTVYTGTKAAESLTGGAYGDRYSGVDGNDTIFGFGGDDVLNGGIGEDRLFGGIGADTLIGGSGNDTLAGGAGNDVYMIDTSTDVVVEAKGRGTADLVLSSVNFALAADDDIEALAASRASGTLAIDLTGNDLAQSITGHDGANALKGRGGDDILDGRGGMDTLTGGKGADTFVFATKLGVGNVDRITDFARNDTIRLDDAVFKVLPKGTLAATAFAANRDGRADDASDRIVYETDTGNLYYDPDGAGGAAPILFAKLQPNLSLTSADFVVF
jgi:Ca2+-binding RTX toxin-like protein